MGRHLKQRPKKIKMVECVVEKSISAPYISNKMKGEKVSVPNYLYSKYLESGVVSKKPRKQKIEE